MRLPYYVSLVGVVFCGLGFATAVIGAPYSIVFTAVGAAFCVGSFGLR